MSDENPHSERGSAGKSWLGRIASRFAAEPQDISDLAEIISEAESRNLIDEETKSMLEGVLEVANMRARDLMVPGAQMITLSIEQSIEDILPVLLENNHSRYPVLNEDKDSVEGILIVKDLLQLSLKSELHGHYVRDFLRPAAIIPESKRVDTLLKDFRQKRYHMAIVVDEYGSISGLITIEDILEQIVGDIEDEYDEYEVSAIEETEPGIFLVSALTPLDEFNEAFGTHFDEKNADTIGGIVLHAFAQIPAKGEVIELENLTFEVTKANSRRLVQLKVFPAKNNSETEET